MAQLTSIKKWGENSKQVDNNTLKWKKCNQSAAIDNVVVKHKQNNVCSRRSWLHYSQAQFNPSSDQVNISVKGQNPKSDLRYRRPHISQAYPTHVPRRITWSAVKQHGCCSKSCDTAANFTSDHLPQTGVIIFDHADASPCLASSASADKSTNVTTPGYISEMLRRIRKELGVREPSRADREARKQIGELAGAGTPQLSGDGERGTPTTAAATSLAVQSSPVCSHGLSPDSCAGPPRTDPTEKSTAFKMGQEGPETCGVSSRFSRETSGPPNSKCAPLDPDANLCGRARTAQNPKRGLEEKQNRNKLSWNSVKRKRPEEATDIPR